MPLMSLIDSPFYTYIVNLNRYDILRYSCMFESLNSLSISKSCLLDFHLKYTTCMSTSLALRTSSYSKENTLSVYRALHISMFFSSNLPVSDLAVRD